MRYEVGDGIVLQNSVFVTVVDTARPIGESGDFVAGFGGFPIRCCCWTEQDAEKIAAALNAAEKETGL